jgi:hypothetical protein
MRMPHVVLVVLEVIPEHEGVHGPIRLEKSIEAHAKPELAQRAQHFRLFLQELRPIEDAKKPDASPIPPIEQRLERFDAEMTHQDEEMRLLREVVARFDRVDQLKRRFDNGQIHD